MINAVEKSEDEAQSEDQNKNFARFVCRHFTFHASWKGDNDDQVMTSST